MAEDIPTESIEDEAFRLLCDQWDGNPTARAGFASKGNFVVARFPATVFSLRAKRVLSKPAEKNKAK